jgi:hypothetical protein
MNEEERKQKEWDDNRVAQARRMHANGFTIGQIGVYMQTLDAAIRVIDRKDAEIKRLRVAIQSAIVGLEVAGDFNLVAAALNERTHLRAALEESEDTR